MNYDMSTKCLKYAICTWPINIFRQMEDAYVDTKAGQ